MKDGANLEAWSPLGDQGSNNLSNETLVQIGKNHGKSVAQDILRWDIQSGVVTIPNAQVDFAFFK